MGMPSFHFQDRSKAIEPKDLELAKTSKIMDGMHIFQLEILFGNFGLHLNKSCFPEKISIQGDKINLAIYIPSKLSGFSG